MKLLHTFDNRDAAALVASFNPTPDDSVNCASCENITPLGCRYGRCTARWADSHRTCPMDSHLPD